MSHLPEGLLRIEGWMVLLKPKRRNDEGRDEVSKKITREIKNNSHKNVTLSTHCRDPHRRTGS